MGGLGEEYERVVDEELDKDGEGRKMKGLEGSWS